MHPAISDAAVVAMSSPGGEDDVAVAIEVSKSREGDYDDLLRHSYQRPANPGDADYRVARRGPRNTRLAIALTEGTLYHRSNRLLCSTSDRGVGREQVAADPFGDAGYDL